MSDTATTHAGRCLCGANRFEAAGAPRFVAHCHCESCRRQTAAIAATYVGFRDQQVTFTGSNRRLYESSPGVTRSFCATCGTPLTYQSEDYPGETHLFLANFETPETFTVTGHSFTEERLPGIVLDPALLDRN